MKRTIVIMAVVAALGAASAQNRYQAVGTGVGVAAGWSTHDGLTFTPRGGEHPS